MPISLPPGLYVHYSAPGGGAGFASSGAPGTSYGGYCSSTAVAQGTTVSALFPSLVRFRRLEDIYIRIHWRCLFVVNNTGASVTPTISVTSTDPPVDFFSAGPRTDMTVYWAAIAASPWESASLQAEVSSAGGGPITVALIDYEPASGSAAAIPQGYCRGFWVFNRVSSGTFPGTANHMTRSSTYTLSVTT